MGAHDGHRNRMREKIAQGGLDTLQDHEVLEYILFHFVPMRNTNEMAHELIDAFGSFSDVLNADVEHLQQISGMTYNAALFLSTLPDVFRRYAADTEKRRNKLCGRGAARAYMQKKMYGYAVEELCVVALDAQDGLIEFECLARGTGAAVSVPIRSVVDFAMRTRAASVIIAHNHPSGNRFPSEEDVAMTKELCYVLGRINVTLQDHFVFCDNEYYSFEREGLLDAIKREI